MNYYQLKAELLSPLMVQENRQSNAPRGLKYLPGSTLRGAVARHYLRTGGEPGDRAFQMLFMENPVRFPDLLPVDNDAGLPRPLPMTAYSCKRSPGFIPNHGHGVGDALAVLLAAEMEGRPLTEAFLCPICGEDMKPFQGIWNGDEKSPEKYETVPVYQRHTGIDRTTGTVATSIFYITQGIAEGAKRSDHQIHSQHLAGSLFLADEQAEALRGMIAESIFAGADRTRGMGEILLSLSPAKPPSFDMADWDSRFRKKLAGQTGHELPSGLYFSIGFDSHAILVDRFLRPTLDFELDIEGASPVKRVVQPAPVRGWQSSWRLPKPEDTAATSGSVYLFRYEGEDRRELEDFLSQLTMDGIGLRRTEGFGRVQVCDAMHLQEVI